MSATNIQNVGNNNVSYQVGDQTIVKGIHWIDSMIQFHTGAVTKYDEASRRKQADFHQERLDFFTHIRQQYGTT